ncbi:hypothetical protein HGM15179_017375 [Zosterops borbonicus]|uniref:Uncharacterized protein n=1 Tax=Zosterops borbonicus TaxID=364589 RepID=A0A8K1G172_9PASS|nr:hypothetical protein HGM15179_017375 [Zosterops borbonicus]
MEKYNYWYMRLKAIEARNFMLHEIAEPENSGGIPEAIENGVTSLVWASGTSGCSWRAQPVSITLKPGSKLIAVVPGKGRNAPPHKGIAKARKAYTLNQDQFQKEEKKGCSGRQLLSKEKRASSMLEGPCSQGSLLPPWVKDIARKLPSLVQPLDYYLLVVFHVDGDEVAICIPKVIKRDFKALGWLHLDADSMVTFLGIEGKDLNVCPINNWMNFDEIDLLALQDPPGIFELVELVDNGTYEQQFLF